jgi:hypothetical protein
LVQRIKNLFIVDFKSLFNARFPSSLQTCQLRFQVQKLGVNFATKFASTFQCLNYCKQRFIVQVQINNSMESSWFRGLPRRFVFGYYYWVWTFVYKRSSNIEINLRTLLRSSRSISEFGNVIGKFATNWLEIDNKVYRTIYKLTKEMWCAKQDYSSYEDMQLRYNTFISHETWTRGTKLVHDYCSWQVDHSLEVAMTCCWQRPLKVPEAIIIV